MCNLDNLVIVSNSWITLPCSRSKALFWMNEFFSPLEINVFRAESRALCWQPFQVKSVTFTWQCNLHKSVFWLSKKKEKKKLNSGPNRPDNLTLLGVRFTSSSLPSQTFACLRAWASVFCMRNLQLHLGCWSASTLQSSRCLGRHLLLAVSLSFSDCFWRICSRQVYKYVIVLLNNVFKPEGWEVWRPGCLLFSITV